ncbi:unnamed protein product [Gadus morhua 'NCC']
MAASVRNIVVPDFRPLDLSISFCSSHAGGNYSEIQLEIRAGLLPPLSAHKNGQGVEPDAWQFAETKPFV